MEEENKFDIATHVLVPKHEKASIDEIKEILKKYNISLKQFPFIRTTDSAIKGLSVKQGDVIKITRNSPTVGEYVYYRVVING